MAQFFYDLLNSKAYFLFTVLIVMPINGMLITINFWYVLLILTQIPYFLARTKKLWEE